MISQQVDRAAKIIHQMRDLTKRSERLLVPLDINALVHESVDFLTPQMRLSMVDVILDLGEGLPRVKGDRVRLEQVFLNLLTNARQAMEDSPTRRLTVQTRYREKEECPIEIFVSDTGKGFHPEDVEKLFTPFYSTKLAGHGTGLGLSISLRIIREHQGSIEASGTPGHGAVFTVRLPAAANDDGSET
jgi:signal transduction histidine kinase